MSRKFQKIAEVVWPLPKWIQNSASAIWPVTLLIMLVIVPFAVLKSRKELKNETR